MYFNERNGLATLRATEKLLNLKACWKKNGNGKPVIVFFRGMLAVKNQAKLRIQESGCAKDDLNLGVFNLCLFEFVRVKDALILYLVRLPLFLEDVQLAVVMEKSLEILSGLVL